MSRPEKTQENINLSLKMSNNECENEELELSLGLSMNGQFGVDKRLKRSSSISDFPFSSKNGNVFDARGVAFDSHAPLVRTCSLPVVQSEEEFWKRKEEQSARRLEARMKRLEKKNGKVINCFDEGSNSNSNNGESLVKSKSNNESGVVGLNVLGSQGSIGSQKSGSSGLSDLHSQQQVEGTAQKAEVKSPSSVRSVQVQVKQEPHVNVNGKRTRSVQVQVKQESHVNVNGKRTTEVVKSTLIDMPFVSTTTDGKRIEGFLYKYKKGEEVKIVCVCHGLFLSPAEFIKHGGGGDVEHPLKHIVVSTAPMF